ncbi:DPP IV N-terminal domain-containing protein [Hoylesella buccalis]|uniref:S9 family peptidase n=1 Tax=Hoylesella buccalis TaxID=28127 RepID=UPI003993FE4B
MNKTWFSFLTLIALFVGGQQMMAQKQFTLEELNFGGKNYRQFVPENRYTTWWGDELIRTEANQCSVIDKKTGKERILFTLDEINKYAVSDCSSQVKNLFSASFPYPGKSLVLLRNGATMSLYNWKTKKTEWCRSTADEGEVAEWNAISKATSYIEPKSQQLHVRTADGNDTQLTTDGSREIVYGQSVHRDEFGIRKGMFWAPNGQKLAFYRMDQSMVADYPQVNIFDRIAKCEPDKYPMAGETSHKVTVLVYDLTTKKTVTLQAGDPTDRYFTNIAWSPDSKTIYMFELNRDQNDFRLVSYDAQTGTKIAELYRETHDKYVEPQHPIAFLPWDNNLFIMQSQHDGYNHLYLYQANGKLVKQLTKGKWVVLDVIGFNAKDKSIVYTSSEKHALQTNTYAVNIKTGKRRLLDNGRGYHSPSLSSSGAFIVDKYSEPTVPRNIEIINTANGKRTQYFEAADPWKGYQVPTFTCGTIKAADGTTDLYYRMVKPANFDKNKKYPLVLYVYGGPHAHNVDARWHYASRSWETYMAQKGYILLILDNRGSERRGRDFEQATFRQLGQIEMQDQMKGIEYVKTLPYVDTDRIGVHGWSFGGFMTISLMTNYPETFKVGVAGGPVIDWKWYEVMYGERYMDTPQANPEGYSKTSLIPQAKNLKGKLQIIQGTNDKTVVPQHCLSFIAECIKQGTQPDFFVYPGEPHNMRGHQSVHLHERITQYFEDYLK